MPQRHCYFQRRIVNTKWMVNAECLPYLMDQCAVDAVVTVLLGNIRKPIRIPTHTWTLIEDYLAGNLEWIMIHSRAP